MGDDGRRAGEWRHLLRPQPRVEEAAERLPADLLRERDELRGGADAVAVLDGPAVQEREERGIADRAAQRVHGERAPLVDGVGERPPGSGIEDRAKLVGLLG